MLSATTLRRVLPALLAVFGALLLAPVTANAHADLDYSVPADGDAVGSPLEEITVAFTEPVTVVGFGVLDPQYQVLSPEVVTEDDMVFRLRIDPITTGTVAVRYEVQADDGHVIEGSFTFVIDERLPAPTVATASVSREAPTVTASDDDDGGGIWVIAAIVSVVVLGAGGFALAIVRSRPR